MQQTSEPAFGTPQPLSRPKRIARYLGRRLMRRVFFPGDSLADVVRRTAFFVIGWGTFIGLLAWGAYRQGILHGVGDGILFCGVFFGLAVLMAPDFTRPGGSQRPNQY